MKLKYVEYKKRANLLATVDNTPTMTDQSGAEDSDVNTIVKRYGVYGTVPQSKRQALYGEDFSELPDDLRGFIEMARSLEDHKKELPEALASLTVDELVSYSPEAIVELLKPKPQEEGKQ